MVFVTAEAYKNTGVNVILDNENYFWMKMKDVLDGLGVENMRDSVRKQLCGIFETKSLTEEQKKNKIYKNKK